MSSFRYECRTDIDIIAKNSHSDSNSFPVYQNGLHVLHKRSFSVSYLHLAIEVHFEVPDGHGTESVTRLVEDVRQFVLQAAVYRKRTRQNSDEAACRRKASLTASDKRKYFIYESQFKLLGTFWLPFEICCMTFCTSEFLTSRTDWNVFCCETSEQRFAIPIADRPTSIRTETNIDVFKFDFLWMFILLMDNSKEKLQAIFLMQNQLITNYQVLFRMKWKEMRRNRPIRVECRENGANRQRKWTFFLFLFSAGQQNGFCFL